MPEVIDPAAAAGLVRLSPPRRWRPGGRQLDHRGGSPVATRERGVELSFILELVEVLISAERIEAALKEFQAC